MELRPAQRFANRLAERIQGHRWYSRRSPNDRHSRDRPLVYLGEGLGELDHIEAEPIRALLELSRLFAHARGGGMMCASQGMRFSGPRDRDYPVTQLLTYPIQLSEKGGYSSTSSRT